MSFQFNKFSVWLEKKFLDENIEDQHRKRKSVLLVTSIFFMIVTFIVAIFVLLLKQFIFLYYGISILLIYLLFFGFIKIVKNVDAVFLVELIIFILDTLVFIVILGGIPHSGGIIVVGMVCVMFSVHFERIKWSIILFLIYAFSLIVAGILQPILKIEPKLPPNINLILFVVMSVWLCGLTILFISDVVKERIRIKEIMVKKLQELDKAKTNLYTNITHEFRTPITVILGLTEILHDQLNKKQKEDLSLISKNGEKLLNLVNQMLDLSKLDSGTIELNNINGNIIDSVDYVIASFESISKQKNTVIHKFYDIPEFFMDYDPEKMESVLTNLLDNALKNTENGNIYFSIYYEKESQSLIIKIKDTGSGIPAEHAKKIFDRFFQVEKSESGLTGGTGIGLAIVKEYIQLMGGDIQVTSEIGTGTEFLIQIPVSNELMSVKVPHRKKITENEIVEEEWIDSKNNLPVLLIVEDNPDLIQFLEKLLNDEFEIVIATNGKEGFAKALEHIPDMIISDVMMPKMNGFELTNRLKNDLRTSHIPVLLLTAKADEKSKISGLALGADAYMVKPFNKKELRIRLEKLIELRRKLFLRYSSGNNLEFSSDPVFQKEDMFFKKLNEIILNNLGDEFFSIQKLCDEMAISKSQLYRKFKALTNDSAARYIRRQRMKRAKELLQSSDMNITQVGYEVGMTSISVFSRIFKEEYGCSPTEFVQRKSLTDDVR
jgi:signal transduction histidine kinase/DNA-binding response OmpR family regulator